MPEPADGVTPIEEAEAQEVRISYERDEDVVKIKLTLGDATIKIKSTSEQGGDDAAMLVQILPRALERTYAQLAEEEK